MHSTTDLYILGNIDGFVTLLQRLSRSDVWLCCVVAQGTAAKLSLNMLWMSLDVLTAEALTLG